jgi:hypothetical protein
MKAEEWRNLPTESRVRAVTHRHNGWQLGRIAVRT